MSLIALGVLLIGVFLIYLSSRPSADLYANGSESLGVEPKYSIDSKMVNYYEDTEGYLARPDDNEVYPGVVMIHEWWGLNDNIKSMADNLASQGYVVLAVDLYNGQVATDATQAQELVAGVTNDQQKALENMRAATTYLKGEENADKVASLGWCFGGGQSLQLSLNQTMDATVIYYGNLVTDKTKLVKIKGPVLGIFGSEDNVVPVSSVTTFDKTLDDLFKENKIYVYEGVGHAFANPTGDNYAKAETRDAWGKTLDFLDNNLK